jgi:hypothetical protein
MNDLPGVDLAKVREQAAADKAAREARAQANIDRYVARWHKAMNKTFKGISGASSLDRRFRLRAEGKRIERES